MPDPTPEERTYGRELLKRGMWENLGVDRAQGAPYDDSPTIQDIQRRQARGQPDIGDLQIYQNQMEQNLQRPIAPRDMTPPIRNINLESVEYNPFSTEPTFATLHPVEQNPFQSDPYTAAQPPAGFRDPLGPVITKAATDFFGGPGRAAAPNPYPPGSEEWESYEQSRSSGMSQWGAETAKQMIGGGTSFAARAALGTSGGAAKANETIVAAALRSHKGGVFSGANHGEAFVKAAKQGEAGNATENGFLTNTGRFVDRKEALKIAEKSQSVSPSQLQHKDLLSAEQLTGDLHLTPVEYDPFPQ